MSSLVADMLQFSVGTTPADVAFVAAHMRQADVDEVRAAGWDPLPALQDGAANSMLLWTAKDGNTPVAILGMGAPSLLGDVGVPWFLGTDQVHKHRRAFVRTAPTYLRQMLAFYPRLMNYVHTENRQAILWLRKTGFKLGAAVRAPTGARFYPFEMTRN